jgi:hypothetical protein
MSSFSRFLVTGLGSVTRINTRIFPDAASGTPHARPRKEIGGLTAVAGRVGRSRYNAPSANWDSQTDQSGALGRHSFSQLDELTLVGDLELLAGWRSHVARQRLGGIILTAERLVEDQLREFTRREPRVPAFLGEPSKRQAAITLDPVPTEDCRVEALGGHRFDPVAKEEANRSQRTFLFHAGPSSFRRIAD